MDATRRVASPAQIRDLLARDHSLNGGILFGLEGFIVELQGRAVEALRKPASITSCSRITGMASGTVREAFDRISGAFAKN